jgi:hypothetical protein
MSEPDAATPDEPFRPDWVNYEQGRKDGWTEALIADPDYARVFTMARCLGWAEGYAVVLHGTATRDLDLLAVPWTDAACDPNHLVRRIADAAGLKYAHKAPSGKPHGRLAWTLLFPAFADPRFVDISIMPRAKTVSA